MRKNRRHTCLQGLMLICLMALALPLSAQDDEMDAVMEKPLTIVDGSHLTASVKMGYSNLMVNSEKLKNSPGGFGVGAEIDYTHFVSTHIGLRVGCDVSIHISKYRMASYSAQSSEEIQVYTNPSLGESQTVEAEYKTTTVDIVSDYMYSAIGIPVALAFQGESWYASAGVKFNIPLKLRESSKYGETQTECVSIGNNDVSIPGEVIPGQRIEAIPYNSSARGNTFKPFFVSSLIEGGYRLGSPRGDAIEMGVYAEFSFNECHPGSEKPLAARTNGKIESLPTLLSNAVQSLRLFNVGVKLQYDFSFRHPRRK
ncbi:MAG: hypothetical protein J5711_01660 [Bacteroidales bacterium]|nr:hypothetical protein [Bacteroidales bacterium]